MIKVTGKIIVNTSIMKYHLVRVSYLRYNKNETKPDNLYLYRSPKLEPPSKSEFEHNFEFSCTTYFNDATVFLILKKHVFLGTEILLNCGMKLAQLYKLGPPELMPTSVTKRPHDEIKLFLGFEPQIWSPRPPLNCSDLFFFAEIPINIEPQSVYQALIVITLDNKDGKPINNVNDLKGMQARKVECTFDLPCFRMSNHFVMHMNELHIPVFQVDKSQEEFDVHYCLSERIECDIHDSYLNLVNIQPRELGSATVKPNTFKHNDRNYWTCPPCAFCPTDFQQETYKLIEIPAFTFSAKGRFKESYTTIQITKPPYRKQVFNEFLDMELSLLYYVAQILDALSLRYSDVTLSPKLCFSENAAWQWREAPRYF